MVKNTKGGNKAKKIGRKFLEDETTINIRYKKEEGEIYCVVTKILGGENCEVICEDTNTRLCVIRGKFRGKKKRNNLIKQGTLILAGKREWEITNISKRDKCDLLCIYSDNEKNKIIKSIDNESIRKLLHYDDDCETHDNLEFIKTDENQIPDIKPIENKNTNKFEFDFDSI